jgi:catechol 2,3-dioxygenase-like lactoylglutathione lyase family enzyme
VHTCFLAADGEYESWKAYLEGRDVRVIQEVRWGDRGLSFYFEDPDGNLLEIASADIWPR